MLKLTYIAQSCSQSRSNNDPEKEQNKVSTQIMFFQMGQFVIDKHFGCNITMDLVLLDILLGLFINNNFVKQNSKSFG